MDDAAAVAKASQVVVFGTIVNTNGTSVDQLGTIHTDYTLKIDKVYKGDLEVGDEINVDLPGGTIPMGDYIGELDRPGLY